MESVYKMVNSVPRDQFNLFVIITATFPLGYLNKYVNGSVLRLLYSLIIGVIAQYFMFGLEFLHVLLCALINLALLYSVPRQNTGWALTIFSFAYLSFIHIRRMVNDYAGWSMDISLIMMMVVCKFSSFGFCYQDGKEDQAKISPFKKKFAIYQFTVLEYLSYVFFYPTAIMGPFFEFTDFKSFIRKEGDFQYIPDTLRPGLIRYLTGVFFVGVYLLLKNYTSASYFINNAGSEYFPIYIAVFALWPQIVRYLIGFCLAESVCIVSGASYQPKDPDHSNKNLNHEENFDRIKNVDIFHVLIPVRITSFFRHWNISVHNWLKRYINFRLFSDEEYKKSVNSFKAKAITFMVSGFWHGFYPNYYIIFAHFPLAVITESNLEYIKTKVFHNHRKVFWIIDKIYTVYVCFFASYMVGVLEGLRFTECYRFMKRVYFLPTVLQIVILVITVLVIRFVKSRQRVSKIK